MPAPEDFETPIGFYLGTDLAVSHGAILYSVASSSSFTAYGSRLDEAANCDDTPGAAELRVATEVVDLWEEFESPFRFSASDSLMASVPIQIGWLLGGILFGLGIKSISRRS